MSGRPSVRSLSVPGLALGGVLLGHAATYALLHPSSYARERALQATGHAYLGTAARFVLPLTVVALSASLLGRVMRGHADATRRYDLASRLIGFQAGVFVTMELLERLASGSRAEGLGSSLAVGLPVQILVALGLTWFLARLLNGVERAVEILRPSAAPLPRRASLAWALGSEVAAGLDRADAVTIRGPPATR